MAKNINKADVAQLAAALAARKTNAFCGRERETKLMEVMVCKEEEGKGKAGMRREERREKKGGGHVESENRLLFFRPKAWLSITAGSLQPQTDLLA